MNWRMFLRDHWRLIACYLAGVVLALAVIVLDAVNHGYAVPFPDALYALGLASVLLAISLAIEYAIRRRAYRHANILLWSLHHNDIGAIPETGTLEQRFWVRLIRQMQGAYLGKLADAEEKRHFYEIFLTRFAHQMKTPLTVMQLLEQELKAIVRETPDPVRALELLDSLAEERERLDHNLNLILQTARLTSFSFDVHIEPVEMVALLRDAVNEHKTAWIRRALYPRLVCPDEPVIVHTDRKWMSFICDQFLRNALQYGVRQGTQEASPFVIEVKRHPGHVTVSFIDRGIGIPERDLPHIFDPFFTGANGRTHSRATGMGLYLVKRVCDRLGHRVEVDSQENVGTTFTLIVDEPGFYAPMAQD